MLLYSKSITPRLRFISNFIGTELTGQSLQLTDDINVFASFDGVRINYSEQKLTDQECWIVPQGLLSETGIQQQPIKCSDYNDKPCFFQTTGDFPFDILAACFYLLSRYEEYLPHEKDMYGRYSHKNSIAFKQGFLNVPLVNQWVQDFADLLEKIFAGSLLQPAVFRFLPTYDIDEAWSFKHKSWARNAGASIKDILKGRIKELRLRGKVLAHKTADPFDAYEWMHSLHDRYKLEPYYFFLLPSRTGRYDRNILPTQSALKELIRIHRKRYRVGIHPSWQSGDDTALLKQEIGTLSSIINEKVVSSRQHFIRFTLPATFRLLMDAGIREDFSMGYGSINGFRASCASPFYWYDLEKEKQTDLLLCPFCYMDANSFYEQKLSAAEALDEMRHYYRVVKNVNGLLITLWHNTFLGTDYRFAGWRDVYEQFLHESHQ